MRNKGSCIEKKLGETLIRLLKNVWRGGKVNEPGHNEPGHYEPEHNEPGHYKRGKNGRTLRFQLLSDQLLGEEGEILKIGGTSTLKIKEGGDE